MEETLEKIIPAFDKGMFKDASWLPLTRIIHRENKIGNPWLQIFKY